MATGVNVQHVSPTELYDVMTAASSQDPSRIQASSKRLKQMLDMFGTYDALHEIAGQRTVPLAIRQQAIIQFKNAALGHWRSRKVLNDEHRVRIRNRCLTFLDEEDETIAHCNEVIVAKISRQDFPNNWGNLMRDLVNVIDLNLRKRYEAMIEDRRDTLMLRRSLKLLNVILKEFASIKMLNGVKTMATLVDDLRPRMYGYYSQMAARISPSTVTPQTFSSPRIHDDILLAHLVYKSMVKMTVWLWNRIDKIAKEDADRNRVWIHEVFQNSAVQLKALTELRTNTLVALMRGGLSSDPQVQRSLDIFTRHIRVFGKFFRRLQQLSPSRFVALPMCGDLILFYWSQVVKATSEPADLISDSNQAAYPVRHLVQGMVLFKESLAQWTPTRRDGTPNENALSREFVENAVQLLVTRFMPLNPKDLENWMADPEEWVNVEDRENDLWEYEIRPCSERVLVQISNQYPQFVTPLLESTFKQIAAQPPAGDLQSVLQKEAIYCALGRCAIRLKDVIPFKDWLEHTLITEARDPNPSYPIIKRRIAWLIGKWVSDSCTSPNNSRIWEILVHLLKDRGPGTDYVVRLTAVVALKECIDVRASIDLSVVLVKARATKTLEFESSYFEPYLPTAVSELIGMMGEADTFESKRRIDHTLNVVIEQVKELIIPFIATITEPLPKLWIEAGDQWLFKSSLLVTMSKLIESVKGQSTSLGGIVVPLIRDSLSPGAITNLDDDALTLWLTALRNTLTLTSVNGAPALFDLFPVAVDLLSTNFDLLGKIISILESYFLLDAPGLLQACNVQLFSAFLAAFKNESVVLLNAADMTRALNLLVQMAPSTLWGEALHSSGLFAYILTTLVEGEASTLLLSEQVLFLSRVAMADRQMFLQLISATASSLNQKESYLYDNMLDQWFGKFDNMSEPRHRKLTAMGIGPLVSTGRPEILQRLPVEIFNLWIDVFYEIKEAQVVVEIQGDSSPIPSSHNLRRHWELNEAPPEYYRDIEGTPEHDRRKALYDRDPVRTMHLGTFVATQLREAEAAFGPATFQAQYLSKADPTVLGQIQVELART
ncbi:putative ARM repeat-containing protein [Lyophyllum shimeji]|uniref:ARM repeat-containing protein n=1 Tax=Lyophyllum shimeji TaxID=47721 RepID=A0A9P3PEF2_LYOSH|nr:putative ARM repeat-containing protein [Lyophyllum shimeji]